MLSHFAFRALAAALWFTGCLTGIGQSAAMASNPPAWVADASLRDVAMIDPQTGWAVGDRGVIWHTDDGGRTWILQPSGVACTLNSVQFIDRVHGWAAGGYQRPYSRRSVGVLLRTSDGGKSWHSDSQPFLPALKTIRFFNAHEGWALGLPTPAFAASLFVTEDGGRSWAPVIAADADEWEAADFVNPRFGALAGVRGQMRIVRRRAIEPAEAPAFGLRRIHGLRLAPDSTGWLTGDGGLLLATADSGRHWKMPANGAALPEGFEGWAIAARGPRVWIAGSPGSIVWHSADAGQTWAAQPTPSLLPIRALEFIDNEHGWAVGSLGLIVSTADGGHTWQRQHAGGERAAWLGLLGDADSAPLELIANLSANEGYLGVVDILTRADLEPVSGTSALSGTRASEALLLAGASEVETAGAFPVRQAGLAIPAEQIAAGWDRAGGSQGMARFQQYLVRQIRTWRPDVIVTHAASPRGEDPLGHAINQLVLRAVEQAGDAAPRAEIDERLGLKPWRVQKVFGYLPAGRSGSLNLSAAQLAPPLGCALADVADRARAVLGAELDAAPTKLSFQLLVDRVPQGAGALDFFSGIVLQAGGEARRAPLEDSQRPDEMLRRSNQRFRNLQAILSYMERKNVSHDQMLAEMGQMVADLEPDQAAELLYKMARQYQASGRWDLAFEMIDLLVTRFPDHALAEPALVWLMQSLASSEVAWHSAPASPMPAALPASVAMQPAKPKAVPSPPATDVRSAQALAIGRLLEQRWAAAFAAPRVQFPLAAIYRRQSPPDGADKLYRNFVSGRPHDPWWSCASAQLWLREPQDACPKPIWHVATAGNKPRLDGRLDDAIWQTAEAVELHSGLNDDRDWPARALAAVDDQFLYLAVQCREAPGCRYPKSTSPRPRDPDLADRDRVEIYLDLDCDWVSYFHLVIDHRGWAAEDCWHDRSWNPRWFVAAEQQSGGWTVEAALPLDALARERPKSKDVWAVGIQRIVPQVGFQSWSTPAAVKPIGEGFGLFMFD
jgi:photosystem II stability/assembly factor-like uncharacterized protein